MSRQITGTLLLPDGSAISDGILTFIADLTANTVLENTLSIINIGSDGSYDITLEPCRYQVYLTRDNQPKLYIGLISVTTSITPTTLDALLIASNPFIDQGTNDTYTDAFAAAQAAYEASLADYVPIVYGDTDIPSDPDNLTLTVIKNNNIPHTPGYSIKATWDACTVPSGDSVVGYILFYYMDDETTNIMTISVDHPIAYITPAIQDVTYTVKVRARSTVYKNLLSTNFDGPETATPTADANTNGIDPTTTEDVTTVGINYINLKWTIVDPTCLTHVYVGDTDYFEIESDPTSENYNKIYSGFGSSLLYSTPLPETPYYFKFVTEDIWGVLSNTSAVTEGFESILIDTTTVDDLVATGTFKAQHLANEINIFDTDPAIAANVVVAGKLAVLDLTSLATNQNFTLGTATNLIGWDYSDSNDPYNLEDNPAGFIALSASSILNNTYEFACGAGDKFYCACKLQWAGSSGAAEKGMTVIFLDSDGDVISDTNIAAYSTSDEMVDDDNYNDTGTYNFVFIDGFIEAPVETNSAYVQLYVDATTTYITFTDIICRKGAAVMIDDGEITADHITADTILTNNLLGVNAEISAKLQVTTGGVFYVGTNPNQLVVPADPMTAGLVMIPTGIYAYDASGNVTFSVDASTGAATFVGSVTVGSTILTEANALNVNATKDNVGLGDVSNLTPVNQTQTGLIVGTTITGGGITLSGGGNIKGGQTDFNTGNGFFLGYTGADYKFSIGVSTGNYLTWDGTDLIIKGSLKIGTTTLDATNTLNENTTSTQVGLGNVSNLTPVNQTQTGLIVGTTITGGGITLSNGGSIHTLNKDSYADVSHPGFFLGYDTGTGDGSTANLYKFDIGSSINYLRWSGTELKLAGIMEIGTTDNIHSAGKDTFVDSTNGVWAGYNTYGVSTIKVSVPSCYFTNIEDDSTVTTIAYVSGDWAYCTDTAKYYEMSGVIAIGGNLTTHANATEYNSTYVNSLLNDNLNAVSIRFNYSYVSFGRSTIVFSSVAKATRICNMFTEASFSTNNYGINIGNDDNFFKFDGEDVEITRSTNIISGTSASLGAVTLDTDYITYVNTGYFIDGNAVLDLDEMGYIARASRTPSYTAGSSPPAGTAIYKLRTTVDIIFESSFVAQTGFPSSMLKAEIVLKITSNFYSLYATNSNPVLGTCYWALRKLL